MSDVSAHQVDTAKIDNNSGVITGKLKDGPTYTVQGPSPSLPNDVTEMRQQRRGGQLPDPVVEPVQPTCSPTSSSSASAPPSSTSSAARPGAR